jgi:pimeloyl-ACP methyl ester carboxylesterase
VFHPTPPPDATAVPGSVYGVTTGFIIYPGARVDPRSYAPVARALAGRGFLVAIVPMGLNLAVLSPDRAGDVIRAYPGIQAWAVGGHSLGGAMAARFVERSPVGVGGLVLWAAYPEEGSRLSDTTLPCMSIFGTADKLATPAEIEKAERLLPRGATMTPIQGGNHSQFGSYGMQPGDTEAVISAAEQQRQVVEATAKLLSEVEAKGPGCSS